MAAQNVYYEDLSFLNLIEKITLNGSNPNEISKQTDKTLDNYEKFVQISNSKMGT